MAASISANSTLTQDAVQRILINPLTQKSSYLSLGFPTFSSNGEPIKVPTLTSLGTPGYVAEGSAIPDVTATTSEVEFLPSSVLAIKVLARMSNELVRAAVVNVEQAFSTKLVSDVTRVLDAAMWDGAGTGGAPLGMARFAGNVNSGTVAGTALASGNLIDMQEDALDNYLDFNALAWAVSPSNWTRIRKMTDNYGARILQPSLAEGAPGTLLGNPYVVSSHVPAGSILLFDRTQVGVGFDQRASITILDQTFADYDQVAVRVTARYDTAALNPGAVIQLHVS